MKLFETPQLQELIAASPEQAAVIRELLAVATDIMCAGYDALPTVENRDKSRMGKQPLYVSPRDMNTLFKRRLADLGWLSEFAIDHGRMAVDFYKQGIIAEVQLGKDVYCAENLHCKFKLAISKQPAVVTAAVLIVPTHDLSRRMSKGIGSFELVMRNYVQPDVLMQRLDYPLLIVGIGAAEVS